MRNIYLWGREEEMKEKEGSRRKGLERGRKRRGEENVMTVKLEAFVKGVWLAASRIALKLRNDDWFLNLELQNLVTLQRV